MERTCLECGDTLKGRADKKFCGDSCRNSYNNRLNKDQKNLIRNINNRLRKNYRILEALDPDKKTKATKNTLLGKGFDFKYFTHTYTTKKGTVYHYLYDLGYFPLEDDLYMIVRDIKKIK